MKWKMVSRFPDYDVSEVGDVRRRTRATRTHVGLILKPAKNSSGYLTVCLYVNKKSYSTPVHQLVAYAFVTKPQGSACVVNHIDGNKQNNNYYNLEWVSVSENNRHAIRMGLNLVPCQSGSKNSQSKLRESDIRAIRSMYLQGKTQKEIGKLFADAMADQWG